MHVIIGAGPIGSATANLLADRGERVRVITRSGTGPRRDGVELVAADASDAARLRSLTGQAAVIYNCANPPYHRWPIDWPPLATALLGAAEASGAVLVTVGNLYGYGPVDAPMTEDTPLAATGPKGRTRAAMWQQALAAHRAGRVRATEARASDFIGARAGSMFTEYILPSVLAGRTARPPAPVDVPHSFTYTLDVARTLLVLGRDERAWGHAWHVPSPPPATLRDLAQRAARLAGAPPPKLAPLPRWTVRAAALFNRLVREYREVAHQFERPFVLDSSRATATFGIHATDLDTILAPSPGAGERRYAGGAPVSAPASSSTSGRPSKSTSE